MKQSNPIASAMTKWLLSIFAGIFLLFFTAKVFAYSFPTHTQNVGYAFNNNGSSGHYNHDMHLTWHKEPVEGWGMYAMYYFTFQAGVGGYTGLQKTVNGKTAIFSIWDANGRQTAMPTPGTVCNRFGHEGTGTNCIINFNWKADTEYKMRVWRILNSTTNQSEKWGAWVINVKTGEETLIGVIELYNANNQIGYGGLNHQGISTVTEFFAGPANADCSNVPEFTVTWKGPYANNGSINPIYAVGGYNTGIGTPCQQTNFTSNGVFSVTQENGQQVRRTTPDGKWLWAHHDLSKYNQIDCMFNWAERQYPDALNQSSFKQRRLSRTKFGYYYRDYTVNGSGSSIVADVISNKVIKSDTGGVNTVVGNLSDILRSSSCGN